MICGPITAVGAASSVTTNAGVPHGAVWIEFLTGATEAATRAVPTAGTVALTGRPEGNPGYSVALTGSPMTASSPQVLTWSGPIELITATPSSVSGNSVTHYRICVREYPS